MITHGGIAEAGALVDLDDDYDRHDARGDEPAHELDATAAAEARRIVGQPPSEPHAPGEG